MCKYSTALWCTVSFVGGAVFDAARCGGDSIGHFNRAVSFINAVCDVN